MHFGWELFEVIDQESDRNEREQNEKVVVALEVTKDGPGVGE